MKRLMPYTGVTSKNDIHSQTVRSGVRQGTFILMEESSPTVGRASCPDRLCFFGCLVAADKGFPGALPVTESYWG